MARDGSAGKHFGRILTAENLLFAALLLIIAAVTIYYRVPLLKFYGFYEPDGFYHYAVVRAAINAGFAVPHVLGISGYPAHAAVTEPSGLYWVTLFPYAILQYAGVSYYTVMRLVPVLFAILDIIGAIYLLRYFNKDRFLAV
ncbi:MAG: hypothetical protein KGH78_04720, partial [Candidatus Micrarchaeota archaeon]|nr:hypothetical protein [Candidatus Micrarchaeota archaeon]